MGYDEEFETMRKKMQDDMDLMRWQHQLTISKLRRSYKTRIDKEAEKLHKDTVTRLSVVESRVTARAGGVLAAILLALVVALYAAWRDVNSSIRDVNQSVNTLQEKLLSAYTSINNTREGL